MVKRIVLSGVLVLLLMSVAGLAAAQGDAGRLVCVMGIGCLHTPLTDENLETIFPELDFLESAGDFVPEGPWGIAYDPGEVVCTSGMTIPMGGETQNVTFTYGISDLPDDTGGLTVEGIDAAGVLLMDRLGPGVFGVSYPMVQDGITVNFTIYAVMTGEVNMEGMIMADWEMPQAACTVTRSFFGAAG